MKSIPNYIIKEATSGEIRKAGGYRNYYKLKMQEVENHFKKETKIGRNKKCPCNSNKKYKKCCGRI